MKLWERFFLKELCINFIFCYLGVHFFYLLIDYACHLKSFAASQLNLAEKIHYYFFQITDIAPIVIPFCMLIVIIKVATTATLKQETIALMSVGITAKKLAYPFLFFAAVCSLYLYINVEFFQPVAFKSKPNIHTHHNSIKLLHLPDHSILLYQHYDPTTSTLSDVYWKNTSDELYRIKELLIQPNRITAYQVHHFVLHDSMISQQNFISTCNLPIPLTIKNLQETAVPLSSRAIRQIVSWIHWNSSSKQQVEAVSWLLYKLLCPLIPFFLALAIIPSCLKFRRSIPIFFLYLTALLSLLCLHMILQAAMILAIHQLFSPWLVLFLPLIFVFMLCTGRYVAFK